MDWHEPFRGYVLAPKTPKEELQHASSTRRMWASQPSTYYILSVRWKKKTLEQLALEDESNKAMPGALCIHKLSVKHILLSHLRSIFKKSGLQQHTASLFFSVSLETTILYCT
jgi:hypothetical protein